MAKRAAAGFLDVSVSPTPANIEHGTALAMGEVPSLIRSEDVAERYNLPWVNNGWEEKMSGPDDDDVNDDRTEREREEDAAEDWEVNNDPYSDDEKEAMDHD